MVKAEREKGQGMAKKTSSTGSSVCSTASTARRDLLYKKVPKQPEVNDEAKWSTFLAAYQNGDWESTQNCARSCSNNARKVRIGKDSAVDNRGEWMAQDDPVQDVEDGDADIAAPFSRLFPQVQVPCSATTSSRKMQGPGCGAVSRDEQQRRDALTDGNHSPSQRAA